MKQRNVGLDLCRILSMLGIVILHIIGKGGAMKALEDANAAKYWSTEWLSICALCSVNVFAIISGYLGVGKKNATVYRTFELIATVLFFCLVITGIFCILMPEKVLNIENVANGIFPALADRYWYITNFVPILLLQPFLNKMILILTERQHKWLCMISLTVFTVLPSATGKDMFVFDAGYSFVWLLCLYVFGAYLKRERVDAFKIPKRYLVLAFFGMSAVLLFGNLFLAYLTGRNYKFFVGYNSPITLLMSLAVFWLLKNANIKAGQGLLKHISLVAFDVYIIHCHIFVYDYVMDDSFAWIPKLSVWLGIPLIIASAVAIYAVCAVVGIVRI